MNPEQLRDHSLVKRALLEAVKAQKSLEDATPLKVAVSNKRDPDEHEFYLIKVGRAIAEVLTACDQISHSVVYMSSFKQSAKTKKAGINRHSHLLYHVENHLIRTHALYDRALQLVDAVFHLLNATEECTQKVVTGNVRVARTDIPKKLKSIRQVLGKTIGARNDVIHHESYKDDELRMLEMYCIYQSLPAEGIASVSQKWIASEIRSLSRATIAGKRRQFEKTNASLFSAVDSLLTALERHYDKESRITKLRVNA